MDTKQKYVRLKEYNEIIIFPTILSHDTFRGFDVIAAGFCYVNKDKISCFGESIGLGIQSKEDDSYFATKQLFGWEAADKLLTQ